MKTVFFDIDTQLDFVSPAGALYVPGSERILPTISGLNRLAVERSIPVISTTDAHSETDPEFESWPPHCVAGTIGQSKPGSTLLPRHATVPSTPGDWPIDGAQQILLEKQALDCFTNPNLTMLLASLAADRYVVYGVVTEYCVRCAALGLLATGARVEVVSDAVKCLSRADEEETLAEVRKAGGNVVRASEV